MGISSRIDGDVAIIAIDNPPVNALAQPVRAALQAAVRAAADDAAVKAIVIHGSGRCFVAGADLREFSAPPRAPLLNDVLLAIESTPKPVVAAMHGMALGGGLELALACHYRCALAGTMIGLPEIKLGLIPGSGGTQRLPRLVGAAPALGMMLTGDPIPAARALELGILDRLVDGGDVAAIGANFARELVARAAPPRRLRELQPEPADTDAALFERERQSRLATDELAGRAIVECVAAAYRQPFDQALALSRRRFEECRDSLASRSLRHLFFAERATALGYRRDARPVQQVAVIGAGTMGSGIATALATSGHAVVLLDPDPAALAAGLERVRAVIDGAVGKGRLDAAEGAAALARLSGAGELAAAADAELVIEAVFESMAVKLEVFRALDRLCRADSVLATNTSTLDVDALAACTGRPQQVVGMHFFSPAQVMRLVEIVRGRASSPAAIATAMAVARRMDKIGVVVGNGFGFVGNRMLYAYGRENQLLLLEGASPAKIDGALRAFGMAMGPNAVGDLAGLDVGYRVRRERADRPTDPRYYRVADLLVEAGRLGQKSGRGAFRYEPGSRTPLPDPEVESMIGAEARRLGIERRAIDDEEIIQRCIYALINEGAALLGEGIAATAADIDVIWCNGYGFPRRRGGPMFHADTVGLSTVLAGIERYARLLGAQNWRPATLLVELASRGSSFVDWDQGRLVARTGTGAPP
jgi:3-hydroxyacyl-CoA dehydrogenase